MIFAGMGAWFAIVAVTLLMAVLSKVSKPVKPQND
jgi:hypothetical protein